MEACNFNQSTWKLRAGGTSKFVGAKGKKRKLFHQLIAMISLPNDVNLAEAPNQSHLAGFADTAILLIQFDKLNFIFNDDYIIIKNDSCDKKVI